MASTLQELIESLHGSDAEGSEVAYALKAVDAIGRDWGDREPPMWHPASDKHPNRGARDAYEMHGDKFRHHYETGGAFAGHLVHPVNDLDAAIAAQKDPAVVHPSNRQLVSNSSVSERSPMNPSNVAHAFYLANPPWYHEFADHSHENHGFVGQATDFANRFLTQNATKPDHPMNPNHPDHEHFLAAHRQGFLTHVWEHPMSIGDPYRSHEPS